MYVWNCVVEDHTPDEFTLGMAKAMVHDKGATLVAVGMYTPVLHATAVLGTTYVQGKAPFGTSTP